MTVWRAHLKTSAAEGVDPHEFARAKRVVGVGWSAGTNRALTWDEYVDIASKVYDEHYNAWWAAVNAIRNRIEREDLCYTRHDGIYYLGRITGDWEYKFEPEYAEADLVNVRCCEWVEVGACDVVPGKVVASFHPQRAVQRVLEVDDYSKRLFNQLSGREQYPVSSKAQTRIWSLLSDDDVENVVSLYLQCEKGYAIIPSTSKSHTATYEFVLKHRESGKTATIQVKSGSEWLSADDFAHLTSQGEVYLFAASGQYEGSPAPRLNYLMPQDIEQFMIANPMVLPGTVRLWMKASGLC